MKDKECTIEYLHELQKLTESLNRLEQKIEKHINKILGGYEDDTVYLTRSEAACYLGISTRQFDRRAKERHFWRYRNADGTELRFNIADFRLSKDKLQDKWVKGILSKQIDANSNVIVPIDNELLKGKNRKIIQEALKTLRQ